MKKATMDFSGLVSVTRNVCGVEVRPLSFGDLSILWQTKGQQMKDAYDKIVKEGETVTDGNVVALVTDLIKFAPELARDVFLLAIGDDGEAHYLGQKLVDGERCDDFATATEVWDTRMGIGKQVELLVAVFDLTVSENDTLKKIFKTTADAMKQKSSTNAVLAVINK